MNVEEEYQDVLQNLEFAIVQVYRQHPQLTDFEVEQAVEALVRKYTAELRQRVMSPLRLNERALQVAELAGSICEWRLGRRATDSSSGNPPSITPPAVTLEVIVACLKRIQKSIKTWTKRGGRQGYLQFVEQFLP